MVATLVAAGPAVLTCRRAAIAAWPAPVPGGGARKRSSRSWRDELADELTRLVWAQMDGIVRGYGITLDPDEPVSPEDLAARARRIGVLPSEP